MNTKTKKDFRYLLKLQNFADQNYQGLIDLANLTLKTKITTDAQLNDALATGSFEHFANIIKGLVPAFQHTITEQLNDATQFYAPFMVSKKTMGEILHIIEHQAGSISDYDPNVRVRTDNDPSNILDYTERTKYKVKSDAVMLQPEFQQAFTNGASFGAWASQMINRQIVLPHKRYLNSVMQKAILGKIQNVKTLYTNEDWDPTIAIRVQETIIKLTQEIKKIGSKPSVLGNLGHTDTDLKWAEARYNADNDTYQADFPFKDHLVNTFDLKQLYLFVSPRTEMALKQGLANVYHDNRLDIITQFKGIVSGYQIPDNEVYVIDAGRAVFIEEVLSTTASQTFASNLSIDTYSHKWYRLGAIPWGTGIKFVITKTPPSSDAPVEDITVTMDDQPEEEVQILTELQKITGIGIATSKKILLKVKNPEEFNFDLLAELKGITPEKIAKIKEVYKVK